MSHAAILGSTPATRIDADASGALRRRMVGVALVSALAGALATALVDRAPQSGTVPDAPAAAPAFPGAAPSEDTSVPAASAVFAGRAPVVEEPAPTF